MAYIIRRPSWAIAERLATPESAFLNRRSILQSMGFGAAALAGALALPGDAAAQDKDPSADLYPPKRNDAYKLDRALTPEDVNANYNNFYEYGTSKNVASASRSLKIRPWEVRIDGMVAKPMTIAIDDLVRKIPLEERLSRHRCVEAWSMTIPWDGFPLSKLLALAEPQPGAKYVRFETFLDPKMAGGQNAFLYPWPYVEGLTIEEAANDLAFVATGAYGKPIAKQHGAPIRLALPWKYGFKSIKSITKISFTDKRPVSFWQQLASNEYGFWANVNPQVDHPRWSQAMERVLHTGENVPTLLFNGYGEQVASLYANLKSESLYM